MRKLSQPSLKTGFLKTLLPAIALASLCNTAQADLIAYWNFDEGAGTTINDISGDAVVHNGTFGAGAQAPAWVPGKFGTAVGFTWQNPNATGSGRLITVPNHPELLLPGPFTISYWYRMDAPTPPSTFPGIMRVGTQSGANAGWGFFRTGNMVYKRSNVQPGVTPPLGVGQWNHIVVSFNGDTNNGTASAQTISYFNGVPFITNTTPWTNITSSAALELGRMDQFDQSTLDDLALFNEAVPRERIRSIYTVQANLPLTYSLGDVRELWAIHARGAGSSGNVKGITWSHVSSLPGSTTPGDAYIAGNSMYVVLGANSGVAASLSMLTGNLSPGGVGTIGEFNLTGSPSVITNTTLTYDLNADTAVGGGTNDLVEVTGDLEIFNSRISVNPLTQLPGGTYRLVNHAGTVTGTFEVLNNTRYTLLLDTNTANQINLTVSGEPADLKWISTANSNWDITSSNWINSTSTLDDRFYQGDSVTFDDSTSASTNINVPIPVFPSSILINSDRGYNFSGVGQIGGAGEGIVKNGTGLTVLGMGNTFIGEVQVNGGTLRLANPSALGSTAAGTIIADGATLDLGGNSPGTESVTVSGAGVNGAGAIVNTGSGLSNNGLKGRVVLAGDTTIGGVNRWDIFGATLVGGTHRLTKVGPPEIALSNLGDTDLGPIDINQGTLTVLGNTQLGNSAMPITINTNAVLAFWGVGTNTINKEVVMNSAIMRNNTSGGNDVATNQGSVTISGDNQFQATANIAILGGIHGDGAVIKNNAGTLYLGGASSYTGRTLVNAGRLAMLQDSIIISPRIQLASGTIFDVSRLSTPFALRLDQIIVGNGSVVGDVHAPTRGVIIPGSENVAGTITFSNNLNLAGGTIAFDITPVNTEGGNANDLVSVSGNLELTETSVIDINPLGLLTPGTTYTLINYTGTLAGSAANLTVTSNSRYTFAVNLDTPGKVLLTVTGGEAADLLWLGGFPGAETLWDVQTTPNWADDLGNQVTFFGGDKVIFDDFSNTNVVDLVGSLTPASIVVENGDLNYTFQGSGRLSGASGITKRFSRTLTIANTGVNDYVGPTTIEEGTLQVGVGGTAGNLGSGPITNNATLVFNRSDNIPLPNALSGSGAVIKQGPGLMTISGPNADFAGSVTVADGTLRPVGAAAVGSTNGGITVNAGATLDINAVNLGAEPVVAGGHGVDGAGAIQNQSGTGQNNALQQVTLTGDTTFGGVGRWDIRGTGSRLDTGGNPYDLTKVGVNQVSLVGTIVDPALGDITINSGTLAAETTATAGDPTKVATVNPGGTLMFWGRSVPWEKVMVLNGSPTRSIFNGNGSSSMIGPWTLNGDVIVEVGGTDLTVNGEIGGDGGLIKRGNSPLILRSNNTYSGSTLVSAGVLQLGNGGDSGSVGTGPITVNSTLTVFRSGVVDMSDNTISGSGNLNVRTPDGLILGSGSPTFGTINLGLTTPGKLIIEEGFNGVVGSISAGENPGGSAGDMTMLGGDIRVNSHMRVGHWPNNVSTFIMGSGTLTLAGTPAGVVNLGGVGEQAGILYLGVDGAGVFMQTGGVASAHGIVLDARGASAGIDTFELQGGEFTVGPSGIKTGSLDANSPSTYSILLGGGTLRASADWTSVLPMTLTGSNGPVTFDTADNDNILSGSLSGQGGLTKIGSGTLALTGIANYEGHTTVSDGTLAVQGSLGIGFGEVIVQSGALTGGGTINDPVTIEAAGTLSPGNGLGRMSVNNTLALGGNTIVEISKTGTALTNDVIAANSIQAGGTLTLVASGEALSLGNSFTIFQTPVINGDFTSINLPTLARGLAWDTSTLTFDGTVSIVGRQLTYSETVLADEPIAYYRFNDTLPTAENSGSLGDAADGTYMDHAAPGNEAPRSPAFYGFEADNTALQLDGTNDFVQAMEGLMNGKPQFTMSGWIRRSMDQANRTGLFGQNDIVEFGYINNNTLHLWTDNQLNVSPNPFPNGQWSHVAVVSEGSPGRALIYTNGVFAAARNHVLPADNTNTFNIGGGGIFDVITVNGNYFRGQIDEVAVFDKALTAEQIAAQYFSTVATPPIITSQPQSTNVFEGADFELSVSVIGSTPFSFQWLNFGEEIPNANGQTLTFSNATELDSSSYQVVISNAFGMVTSDVAEVVVSATEPPTITQQPQSIARFAGLSASLSVAVSGGTVFQYQWYLRGISGDVALNATNATLVFTDLSEADEGEYYVVISNSAGSTESEGALVNVVDPGGAYAQSVINAGPMAYWRFNETEGTIAFDYVGGNDATYVNSTNGPIAPRPPLGGFEADNLAADFNGTNGYVNGPQGLMNDLSVFTMMGWVRRATNQMNRTGLFGQNDIVEFGYINNDTLQLWTDNALNVTPNPFPNEEWSHIAVVSEGSPGTARMYTNGVLAGSRTHTLPANNNEPFNIGGGGIFDSLANNGNWFNGQIDEVAIFSTALDPELIAQIYRGATERRLTMEYNPGPPPSMILRWPAGGVLESTNDLGGQWDPVEGAESPYTVPMDEPHRFYRVRF